MDNETEIIESENKNIEESVEKLVESAEKVVEDLKISVMDKTVEIEDLHNLVLEKEEEFNKTKSSLEARISELEAALEESNKARDAVLAELAEIKEEALLRERLDVLKEKDILRSEEEAQVKQAEKIKKLSNEEFEDYVKELSDIREKVSVNATVETPTEKVEDSAEVTVELIENMVGRAANEEVKSQLKKVLETLQLNNSAASVSEEVAEVKKEVAAEKEEDAVSVEQLTEAFKVIALRRKNK
jgi:hypothetical protein